MERSSAECLSSSAILAALILSHPFWWLNADPADEHEIGSNKCAVIGSICNASNWPCSWVAPHWGTGRVLYPLSVRTHSALCPGHTARSNPLHRQLLLCPDNAKLRKRLDFRSLNQPTSDLSAWCLPIHYVLTRELDALSPSYTRLWIMMQHMHIHTHTGHQLKSEIEKRKEYVAITEFSAPMGKIHHLVPVCLLAVHWISKPGVMGIWYLASLCSLAWSLQRTKKTKNNKQNTTGTISSGEILKSIKLPPPLNKLLLSIAFDGRRWSTVRFESSGPLATPLFFIFLIFLFILKTPYFRGLNFLEFLYDLF